MSIIEIEQAVFSSLLHQRCSSSLVWWWTSRWLVNVVSTSAVGVVGWLHLDICLSTTEIALILSIIAIGRRLGLIVGRRRLVGLGRLLGLIIGIVLCLSMSPRCTTCPTCSVERLATALTSATRADASKRRLVVFVGEMSEMEDGLTRRRKTVTGRLPGWHRGRSIFPSYSMWTYICRVVLGNCNIYSWWED